MKKFLNQGVSTPIAIAIIVVLAVFLAGGLFAYQYYYISKQEIKNPVTNGITGPITEDDLLGYWKIGEAEPIAFCFDDSGTRQYRSYLHERPAEWGMWELKNGILTIQYDMPGEKPIVIDFVERTGNQLILRGAVEFDGTYTLVSGCDGKSVNDSIEGWKTYANASLGISIDYPSSWTYQEYSCNIDGVAFCPQKNGATGCGLTCSMDNPSIPISFVFDMWNNSKDKQKSFSLSDTKYKDIFDKMVSSFNPTVGWKTYTNEEYGFEFKYPLTLTARDISKDIVRIDVSTGESNTIGSIAVLVASKNSSIVSESFLETEGSIVSNKTEKISDIVWQKKEIVEFPKNGIGTYGDEIIYYLEKNNIIYSFTCFSCVPPPNGAGLSSDFLPKLLSTFKFTK